VADDLDRNELLLLRMVYLLLGGYAKRDERGLPSQQYLEDTAVEDECRRALAQLLRNGKPLDSGVRYQLAALIDPDSPEPRRLIFGQVKRGNRQDYGRSFAIAHQVIDFLETGLPLKAAIEDTANKFGVSKRTVEAARSRCAPALRRLEEAIKRNLKPPLEWPLAK
jgi:hypothetical protein